MGVPSVGCVGECATRPACRRCCFSRVIARQLMVLTASVALEATAWSGRQRPPETTVHESRQRPDRLDTATQRIYEGS